MHCQIQIQRDLEGLVIRLAGRLTEAEVPDLIQVCHQSSSTAIILDLEELISTDPVGMDALRRMERRGVRLIDVPEYVRLELDTLERRNRR